MAGDPSSIQRGASSAVSPLVSGLFAADTRDVGPGLAASGNYIPAPKRVPVSRYFDPAFAELEKEKLWKKVWQYACREEDLPNVGDRLPYTVGELSFIIVRSGPNEFKAFNNACLHRGTQLCDGQGSGASFRCPFHAWEWNLDGSLKNIPSRWDFGNVTDETYKLGEVKLDTWGGYIFINPDPNAGPLKDAVGPLTEYFKLAPAEDRYTAFHIRKKVRANWKVVMEAFLEGYHVIETHTDSMPFTGDANTQYDVWEDGKSHTSRLITPMGIPSPHLGDKASVELAANMTFAAFAMGMPGITPPQFDPNSPLNARAQVAAWRRELMGQMLGRDFSAVPDSNYVDATQYWMFPNFCPWYGEGLPLVYQFIPYGSNPDESIMDVRLTAPLPGGGVPPPPSAPVIEIDFDQPFNSNPEIGILAHIFDQDMSNVPRIQRGLKTMPAGHQFVTFGHYQEQRIAHFHELLEKQLGL